MNRIRLDKTDPDAPDLVVEVWVEGTGGDADALLETREIPHPIHVTVPTGHYLVIKEKPM